VAALRTQALCPVIFVAAGLLLVKIVIDLRQVRDAQRGDLMSLHLMPNLFDVVGVGRKCLVVSS
jgi:hypothetical protein